MINLGSVAPLGKESGIAELALIAESGADDIALALQEILREHPL